MSLCSSPNSGIDLRFMLETTNYDVDARLTSNQVCMIIDAIVCVVVRVVCRLVFVRSRSLSGVCCVAKRELNRYANTVS